jgi:hypothetical protein
MFFAALSKAGRAELWLNIKVSEEYKTQNKLPLLLQV